MDVKLTNLRNKIENFSIENQKKILELLVKHDVIINETSNCCCINLSCLSEDVIDKLTSQVDLTELREKELNKTENDKIKLEETYFTK